MQDEKENPTRSLKTIKKKVHDWEFRHPWPAHIFEYILLFLFVAFVISHIFARFDLYHTESDSARYMLSALVQSQAAIVAIVITLTLIAVQLTASAYSPRVVDIFKKNPDMWILLGCYGVSIFYGLIVLKLVEGAEGEFVSQSAIWSLGRFSISFESCVSLAYWLGTFTFVALIPYMWNIISLLKSEHIIKQLAIEITKPNLLNSKEDPIQPIVDIIHGSIMKYDLATTRVGLKAVTKQVINVIYLDSEKEISGRYCSHLERVGRLAASREDAESIVEVVKNLEIFGKSTAEKGLKIATSQSAASLGVVGRSATEKGFRHVVWIVEDSLGAVGRSAAKKGLEGATQIAIKYLKAVGRVEAKQRVFGATYQIAESLIVIGTVTAEKCIEKVAWQAAMSLAELTILSEEPTTEAIRSCELEYREDGSFQKFMKIYEQELEKLRAEK